MAKNNKFNQLALCCVDTIDVHTAPPKQNNNIMRKHYRLFAISILIAITATDVKAQVMSAMGNFSPSTSTLIGSASRIGFDNGSWSTYYMRYNDSSYFCDHHTYGYWPVWAPAISSTRVTMPQDFVITDFKKFLNDPGYIGSYQGMGMYGYSLGYNLYNYNYFRIITLPDVSQLNRTTVAHPTGQNATIGMKFLSIGEKTDYRHSNPQSYLLEYYLWANTTYTYAPLAYNPQSNEQEIADDVITHENYVIFATRDTRSGYAPVNLRISDTNGVLINTSINYQWQFLLPDYDSLSSEVRLINLDGKEFVLAYTKCNRRENNAYYLCVHRIDLINFLSNNNSIVTHEIPINKRCVNIADMVFNPNVRTLVILLNGHSQSELYHLNPYSNTTDIIAKLDYPDGSFHSIDTVMSDYNSNEIMYVAMGDSVTFLQNLSTVNHSCFNITPQVSLLRTPPTIGYIKDPLEHYNGDQQYDASTPLDVIFFGTRTCNIVNE